MHHQNKNNSLLDNNSNYQTATLQTASVNTMFGNINIENRRNTENVIPSQHGSTFNIQPDHESASVSDLSAYN